jgi:hypothetical protein
MKRAHLLSVVLVSWLLAAPAWAHHYVWLDFSSFDLSAWTVVNGNAPPTTADVTAVRELTLALMQEHYSAFDVTFTTVAPSSGRYTHVQFLPLAVGTPASGVTFGCAGPSCCTSALCSGIDSWEASTSGAEVYTGSFALLPAWTGGVNATTARIAHGLGLVASHELGHVLGQRHCNAADDLPPSCSGGLGGSTDPNLDFHIMGSPASTGVTLGEMATNDSFFSVHSSRPGLHRRVQVRNHWNALGDTNGDALADLAYGRLSSPTLMPWFDRASTGSSFGPYSVWTGDGGQRMDLFLEGDVTGDGQADLVYGRIVSAGVVQWYVQASSGSAFGAPVLWSGDAGDAGDIFRLGDVDGDGDADLIYGRPLTPDVVTWYVRLSSGSGFGSYSVWSGDAGKRSDLFLVGDVDGDGLADLVAVERGLTGGTWVYVSTGSSFSFEESDYIVFSPDYVMLGDVSGDGQADLVTGRWLETTPSVVEWKVRLSNGCGWEQCFLGPDVWADNAGDRGDLFRLGDGNGDGAPDLFYARPVSRLSVPPTRGVLAWYGRNSTGTSFGPYSTWSPNAGDDGDVFP